MAQSLPVEQLRRLWGENIERGRRALTADGSRIRSDGEPSMSQATLAEKCGVTQQTVSDWESGATAPRDHHKLRIAAALHQDVRSLFPLVAVQA
jgi:DNA-binding XRE family transcriptional regulator